MKRRDFITLLGGAAVAWPLAARAQQSVAKVPRIGFLGNSTAELEANLIRPFRDGLRALGYEEGRNIVIEYRWAEGKYERFPALIAELTLLGGAAAAWPLAARAQHGDRMRRIGVIMQMAEKDSQAQLNVSKGDCFSAA